MIRWLVRIAWLLCPLALVIHLVAPGQAVAAFVLACLSLLPLSHTLGEATEELADRLGPVAGSLLNATMGNAAELILGVAALRAGRIDLVKGSLTGSILGNLLLVAGLSIVVGGVRHARLRFSRLAAGASVTTLFLAVVALATPALVGRAAARTGHLLALSVAISAVLLVMYLLSLLFQLREVAREERPARAPLLATPGEAAARAQPAPPKPRGQVRWAVVSLVLASLGTAVSSEVLVSSLEGALVRLHLPELFVGVVIVAFVGNAAEHATALLFAARAEMDVALGIAWESSKQVALFVAPALVFVGLVLGVPMDLSFTTFEVAAVSLAVLATALIALDGQTHWLEGAFLVAVYAVLAIGFWFAG